MNPVIYGAGIVATENGVVDATDPDLTVFNSAVDVRFSATLGGIINTDGKGPTFFPGDASGVENTSGHYA